MQAPPAAARAASRRRAESPDVQAREARRRRAESPRLDPAWPRWSSPKGSRASRARSGTRSSATNRPFLEWDWLASLEQAGTLGEGTGWQPRPLLVREAGRLVAACPLYAKQHSEGEFVFDMGWADAAAARRHRLLPEAARRRALHARSPARASSSQTPATRAHWVRVLGAALRELCRENELLGRARELLPRRRDRAARGIRLPAAARLPVSLEQRGLPRTSRTTSARFAASAATRSAASGARSASRASRHASTSGRRSRTSCSSRCTASISRPSSSTCGAGNT